jgi:hypothetical protein
MLRLVQWSLSNFCNKFIEFIFKWSFCVERNVVRDRAVTNVGHMWHVVINIVLLVLLLTEIELSLGRSTDKTSKKTYT